MKLLFGFLCCLLIGIATAGHLTPVEVNARISNDPSCLDYKVLGVCSKGPLQMGLLVSMNVPTAFVETVGRPGDTLMAIPDFSSLIMKIAGTGLSVGQSNHSGMDNSSEAKVWTFDDSVMNLSRILPKCLVCLPSDSYDTVTAAQDLPSPACDAIASVTGRITQMGSMMPKIPLLPSLAFATEADPVNWRTGCRDQTLTNYLQSNAFTCTISSITGMVGNSASIIANSGPLSKFFGDDACLGSWGALFPRQMRDVGNVPTVSSAKTAYRALHLAKKAYGAVSFPVDQKGRMQQAYPSVSACFKPGASPLPQMPLSTQPVTGSTDGKYAWVYWRPVTCCVSYSKLSQCMKTL